MALIKCKECEAEISSSARECPHCGKKRESKLGVFVLLAIILIIIIGVIISSQEGPPPQSSTSNIISVSEVTDIRRDVYYMAQQFVRKSLKVPSTAKFSDYLRYSDKEIGSANFVSNIWCAWGYVDAQNTFGAMLRNEWEVYLKQLPGDKWQLLYLKLGEEEIGENPLDAQLEAERRARIEMENKLAYEKYYKKEAEEAKQQAIKKQKELEKRKQEEEIFRAKQEQEKLWQQQRYIELQKLYRTKFQSPIGRSIELHLKNGALTQGIVQRITDNSVEIKKGEATISLERTQLTTSALRQCYIQEYSDYMATQQLAEEIKNRTMANIP